MTAYVTRRLLLVIPTLIGAATLVFIAIRLAPGDPATVLLGTFATPQAVAELRQQYGLDQPLYVQYIVFLKDILTLDFGKSYATSRPAMGQILAVLPYSTQLAVTSLLVALVIGIPAGIVAATSRRRWLDGASMLGALALVSVPSFYLGVLLITIFSIGLNLLPVTGAGDTGDPLSLLQHLILPSLALGGSTAAVVARMTRSSMLEVMSREFVVAARAKGLAESAVVLRHALKNAFIPVMTVMGLEIGRLLGGSVVVETVFARPGIGKLLVDSITARDYIQVQASIVVLAVIFVLLNLLTDVSYAALDPRIRYG
jgi:peptide/nickel transport system permease protein